MNQAEVSKLISQLRIAVRPNKRHLKNPAGPEGRLLKLRKTVTALLKHERIELYYNRADEARGYAELLISKAIRHGDTHRATMELADYWLLEKQLVHKLFKVIVPRYEATSEAYTRIFKAPRDYPGMYYRRSVLELRGHPYPSLLPDYTHNRSLIHNVLLDEARKDYRREKFADIAAQIAAESAATPTAPAPAATTTTPSAEAAGASAAAAAEPLAAAASSKDDAQSQSQPQPHPQKTT